MKAFQWSVASACLLFVFGTTTTLASPIGIVPMDSVWKYNADGTDLGTAWRGIGFDDSTWLSGAAQLGYGDGDETTVVVTPAERPPTVYFRKSVLVPSGVTSATISLLRDDGAVVYVNGVEVMRSNMPEGPATYNTLALSAIGGGEENNVFVTGTVSPGVFVPGTNVIAVEIHQNSILSSDMSFALGLIVDFGPPPPVVTVQAIVPETREISPFTDQPIVPGVFRLSRTGTNESLAVAFRLSGSASNGVDYQFVSGAVIPPGAESVDINILAIDDDLAEGTETVVLTLQPGGCLQCYTVGTPAAATVFILDNEPANTVPVVNIFAPPDGASFKTPTNIWLQATAQDAEDADPLTVEFFAGTNRIGAAAFYPTLCPQNCPYYALMWTNVPPGVFTLTARATDNSGATATSAPVHITVVGTNLPPQETIVSVVALDAQASEPGILTVVDAGRFGIIRRGNLHAAIPVSFTLSGTAANGIDYRFISNSVVIPAGVTQALVNVFALMDNVIESTETVVLTLEPRVCPAIFPPPPECYAIGNPQATVFINDGPFSNSPPVVQLNEPVHGAVFNAPANIDLRAFAQDQEDGHDITVEFFAGTNRIGTGIFVPTLCPSPYCPFFQLTWLNVPPGSYALTARATDRLGATTVSAPVQILVNGAPEITTLVATGSVWRYLDDGSDQGTAWRIPEFNDETWPSGMAQLGFGDGDEMTVLSQPGGISHFTYYFRHAFNVTNASGISNLLVRLLRDDGGVVYLNGVEVFRSNMSLTNPFIAFNTPAETCVCCEDEMTRYYDRAVDSGLLVEGRNVIAVEIHQCAIASSDLSFDFELVANRGAVPDRTTVNVRALDAQATEPGIGVSDNGRFIIGRSGNLGVAVPVYFTLTGSASNGSDYHFISNRVVIPAGATQAIVTVFPIADNQPELVETVVLTLLPPVCAAVAIPQPECYLVASPNQATVTIFDAPQTNLPPEVAIITPTNGTVFPESANIQIEALTRDPDGYASRVVFLANDRMIGEVNIAFIQPPPPGEPLVFDMIWTNPPSGQHVLRAQAFDDGGAGSVSPPVVITVLGTNLPPERTIVNVVATDAEARERVVLSDIIVFNHGEFAFRRTGNIGSSIPVYFQISGTAGNGVDYETISSPVVIPAGSTQVVVRVMPVNDNLVESTETVRLTLLHPVCPGGVPPPPECYLFGASTQATVFIADATPPPPPNTNEIVIRFEPPSLPGGSQLISNWFESGFIFHTPNRMGHSDNGVSSLAPSNETAFLQFGANHTPLSIRHAIGALFALRGADVAEYSTVFPVPKHVTFTGFRADGSTVATVLSTDGVIDGSGPAADFQTFTFGPEFSGLVRVEVSPPPYSLDNVRVALSSTNPPPPPPSNQPPFVVIVTPVSGAGFPAGTNIFLGANVVTTSGVQHVEFFTGNTLIGQAVGPLPGPLGSWGLTWNDVPAGGHVLRAVATDTLGRRGTSAPVNITVFGTIGPVVRVFATDSNAVEGAGFIVNTGRFTFTRSGSLSNALPVYFTLSGTASHGIDYLWISNRVIIPPGSSNAHILVTPLDDATVETTETVVLRVLSPPTSPDSIPYMVGSPSVATVLIRDDETNQPPGGILIAAGSVWRYRDIGANLGTAWRALAYDDTAWASGPAQLGFGDGDEATVVDGGPVTNRFITTYFRRTFNVASPDAISNLIVRLLRDDGGVVYLNGVEIFRSNMPAGEVSYFTLASSAADESAGFYSSPVDPSLLVAGENVIAVEIHQNAFSSSDLSFDLELTGSDGPPPAERTVVTVVASDGQASEPDVTAAINPGQFTLRRTGNMDVAIPVSFTLTGTALNGIDYNFISNRIVIPAGSTQAVVTIVPRMDGLAEGIETVVLAVQPPACFEVIPPHPSCYLIGSPSQATVFISDGAGTNDPPVDPILVSTGAVWKYHDLGADLTDWRLPGYDDSGWNSGPAQLGYGDMDEATVVGFGPDLMQKYITTYFRRAIEVADPLAFNSLRLRLLYDDGAVVYLNGSEVFRVNLPPGPVTYTTLASSVSSENAIAEATLPASALVTGRNVIAVEIHQINGLSSDISFDLALTASGETPPALPPTVELVAPADGATFGAPTNIMLAARATDPDGNHTLRWIEFFAGTTRVGIRTNFPGADPVFPVTVNWMNVQPGAYTLTAVATDSDGAKGTSAPVHITVNGPQVPSTNSEVHVVAVYSGNVNGGSSPNHERGDARVSVDRPGKRVVLVLSAYEPVHWLVTVAPDTTLESVLLLGYYDQTIEGLPADTGVVEMTYENSPAGFFYFSYDMNAGSFLGSVQRLCGITGRDISSFHGAYTAPLTPFVVDGVQTDPRLQCDFPQPVDPSQLPNLNFSLSFNNGSDGQVFWQDYSLAGPFQSAAKLLPTYRVVTNGSANFFYGADQHRIWRVDAQHGAVEELHLPPDLPELSWPMGITYDSLRQQILVVSLGGEGHLYSYAPASSQWSLVTSMDNRDVDSLAYHAANDSFYAVTVTHGDYGPPRLLRFNTNGAFVSELPLPQQPFGIGFGAFRSELVSVDEYLVLLLETDNYVPQGAKPEARMYLIDPRSGEVWLTFRRVGNMENRAPTVRIAAPMEGAQLPPGSTTRLSAEASDPDGLVQSVEFFANGASLGMARRADNSPGAFHLDWTPEVGRYTLRARAVDGLGATAWSIPVTVGVGSNVPPETNFTFRLAFNHRDGGAGIFFRHYTLDGPIDGARLLPATRVVPDESGQWYYGAEQHQVWRVNMTGGQVQFMEIGPPLPELSWPIGAAFDSVRNRVLVGTLGGEGHLYAYSAASGQWSLVNELDNHDFDSIVHHLADDSIYAFEGGYGGTSRLVKLDADGNYVSEIPVPQQAGGISGHSSASELVSVGEYLVLLVEPNYYPSEEFIPESRIYLIDPRTGQVRLTYNRARSFDSDRDGVPDDEDQCPGTPWYVPVDEHGCSAGQRDSDQDGVADAADECLNTLAGAIVNGNGCSIAQIAPCDGPWRNHTDYVEAVETAAEAFQKAGLITLDQRQEIVGAARRSDCGYRNPTLTTPLQRTDEIRTNGFRLVLIGDGATTCVVECSTDLIQWTPISTNVLSGGAITIEDPDAMQAPRRFYRLRPDSVAPIQLKTD